MKSLESVKGYKFQGISAGLKKSGKKDLSIVVSEKPAKISVTYTKNVVKAEPLKLNMINLADGNAQALVCNSGNANACTGKQGYISAVAMAQSVAEKFHVDIEDVMVASTGVIGREFPLDGVLSGIEKCSTIVESTPEASESFAEAILTTDTFKKQHFEEIEIEGKIVNFAAVAKGSGMIHPNMGTMMAFVFSDLDISKKLLDSTWKEIIDDTFNMISVDGDTSTNDMAAIMCNGASGNKKIKKAKDKGYNKVYKALKNIAIDLAKQIVKDGEGVSKFVEYKVINAHDKKEAKKIIKTIADSSLVKTAIFGEDPNWGRIFAAAGRAGVDFDPDKCDLLVGDYLIMQDGEGHNEYLESVGKLLKKKEIYITLNLKNGEEFAMGWGTDLTVDYVNFNSEYTT